MLVVLRRFSVGLAAALLTVAAWSPLHANWVNPGDSVVVSDSLSNSIGGPFLVKNLSNGVSFQTLCLEISEVFYPGRTYYVTVENEAIFGGVGAIDGADPLSIDTAYLYYAYVGNTLNGATVGTGTDQWVFSNDDKGHLRALQDAVWHLEEEKTLEEITTKAKDLVSWVTALDADTKQAAGYVRVMNLWTSAGAAYSWDGRAQSMLAIVVPEPASAVTWAGIGGIFVTGWYWRRRRRYGRVA